MNLRRIKDFVWWYNHLVSQGYKRVMCLSYALHNSKHYDRDGNYRKNG